MTSAKDYADFSGALEGRVLESHLDKLPEPDTLCIYMSRGSGADEFRKRHGNIKYVGIVVDGELHKFSADAFIRLLEGLEGSRDDR